MWDNSNVGKRFGRLVITDNGGYSERYGQRVQMAICKCDCGVVKSVMLTELVQGSLHSCGCYRRDLATRHGLRFHPLYKKWLGIKRRCYNKNSPQYRYYGGKGIKVCDEWKDNFKAFYDWAINAPFYGVKNEIDRINNDGDYSPINCRWATRTEQVTNTSRNVYVVFIGETLTLSQLYQKLNIPKSRRATVRRRIVEYKWNLMEAINEFI